VDIFDIVGPVMIGPSSSHTAGIVRIGGFVRKMTGPPKDITVQFSGSLASTYRGHGSDKAIIGGILGFKIDDPRIRESLDIANREGITFRFETVQLKNAHPNSLAVTVTNEQDSIIYVMGESIGGGNIIIRRIDDVDVELSGEYDAIITHHKDEPGIVSLVTNILGIKQINIAGMKVFRASKGGNAIMVIETDGQLDKSLAGILTGLPGIERAKIILGGRV
jgi:L-serine dehydratase